MIAAFSRRPSASLVRACLFGCVAFAMAALPNHLGSTPFDNYVVLAQAFLHGHVWIPHYRAIDSVGFAGRQYIVNDPVPALLLLPYVAVAGLKANQVLLGGVLCFVAGAAAWRLAENLEVPLGRIAVLCAFMFAGTDLWWTGVLGDVWFLAQTSAVTFTLLALVELSGRRPRAWLVGLYFVLASGSRFTMFMALPVFAYLTAIGNLDAFKALDSGRVRRLSQFGAVVAGYLAIWIAYNYVRWGVWYDSGHTIFFHEDMSAGALVGSPFSLANLRGQLYWFFIAPPKFFSMYPFMFPSYRGTALTWTSPALIFAFWAYQPYQTVRALWLAVVLVAAPSFLYYVNGYTQYGMRHALDFEPFLFVLMALAARRSMPPWVIVATIFSILMSAYGIWVWVRFVVPHRALIP